MPHSTDPHLVIVGGGLAGALTAIKVIDRSDAPLRISIVEPREEIGRGIAYSTPDLDHLVNAPASIFSLHPDRPDHLADWLAAHAASRGWAPPAGHGFRESLPPRILFGDYVGSELARALADSGDRVRFEHVRDVAQDLIPDSGGFAVALRSGRRLRADRVVLATGLFPAERAIAIDPVLRNDGRYVPNIWAPGALDAPPASGTIVLLGASLTSLDALISLEKAGFRGRYVAVSRRGLLVKRRREIEPWPSFLAGKPLPRTARALLREVQQARRTIAAAGEDWQRIVPSIRQHLPDLWNGAGNAERLRFIRHLRVFWDVSLHRAAFGSTAWLERIEAEGRFRNVAARIGALEAAPDGKVAVTLRPRGVAADERFVVDRVVNGLGHEFDWRRIDDPLIRNLLDRKLVRPHPTSFGIDADPRTGAVLAGAGGEASEALFAVGHPMRGASWESNGIGEQVAGATKLADAVAPRREAVRRVA